MTKALEALERKQEMANSFQNGWLVEVEDFNSGKMNQGKYELLAQISGPSEFIQTFLKIYPSGDIDGRDYRCDAFSRMNESLARKFEPAKIQKQVVEC